MENDKERNLPFLEHIRELRRRLLVSLLAVFIFAVGSFIFCEPILAILFAPFKALGEATGEHVLYANSLFEGFIIKLQISFLSGVILTFPVHVFNLIRFIFPGLNTREKRIVAISLVSSFFLILVAIFYGYFRVIPVSIELLTSANFIPQDVGLLLNYKANIFFILQFLLVAIAVFQTPIVLELLLIMNVNKRKALLRSSRYVIVALFIVAAVITPGDIIITQLAMAVPLVALYFLTILIAKIFRFGEDR